MDTAEVLERAADLIEFERGWCQETIETRDGRVCMVGALQKSVRACMFGGTSPVGYCAELEAAWIALNVYLDRSPEQWNDVLGRTMEEVLDALRGCAKAWRETQL